MGGPITARHEIYVETKATLGKFYLKKRLLISSLFCQYSEA